MIVLVVCLLFVVILIQTGAIVVGDRHNRLGLKVIASANAIARDSTDSQLRQIHILVNSDMTEARQGELDQALTLLTVIRKLMTLDQDAGHDVSEDEALIEKTENRVAELQVLLADRTVQHALLEKQLIAEMQR